MGKPARSRSLATALAWIMVPWREMALAVALIASAGAPAFLIAAAGIAKAAAADEIAVRVAQAGPATDASIIVESPAFFTSESSLNADRAISSELTRIDGYGAVRRTFLSNTSTRGAATTTAGRQIDVSIRLLSHTDAIASVTPVVSLDGSPQGVWISSWMAEFAELGLGDQLVSGACLEVPIDTPCIDDVPRTPITVVGIYETLWNPERSREGLDVIPGLAPAVVPQYLSIFGLPNYALLLTTDVLMEDLQVSGTASWAVSLDAPVAGFPELQGHVRSIRQLERNVTATNRLVRPLETLSAGQGPPAVNTTLPDTLASSSTALRTLDQPFRSVMVSGIGLGLAAMAAGAAFMVMRRSREFRLLAGEGDRWPDFAKRAAQQLVAPTVVGTALGISLAIFIPSLEHAGSGGADEFRASLSDHLASINISAVIAIGLAGVGIGALVIGFLGERALGDRTPLATSEMAAALLVTLSAASVLLWIQVGDGPPTGSGTNARRAGEVDLSVVALPLVVLITAVAISVLVIRRAIMRLDRFALWLPPTALLAWRRVGNSDAGGYVVIGGLGVALGLVLLTTSLVTTLEDTVELKLATEIGSETMAQIGRPLLVPLPEKSTIIRVDLTRTSPGDRRVQIVAIDTATVGAAVDWPDAYALTLDEALELLESDVGAGIPVIAIEGQQLPSSGAFGQRYSVRYEVVATVPSVPLATRFGSTLLVSRDRLDGFVSASNERTGGTARPPSELYRRRLVSALPGDEIDAFLTLNGISNVEIVTATQRRADASFVAPRYAFDYLRWFGAVAAIESLLSLIFYLSARRNRRALSTIMLRRMGLTPSRAALVTAIEVTVLTAIGAATALLVSPSITQRLLPRFDPAPGVPPAVATNFPLSEAIASLTVGVVALAFLVWLTERRAMSRPEGPVLRGTE